MRDTSASISSRAVEDPVGEESVQKRWYEAVPVCILGILLELVDASKNPGLPDPPVENDEMDPDTVVPNRP